MVVNSKNNRPLIYDAHACVLESNLSKHYNKVYEYDVVYDYLSEEHVHSMKPGIPLSVLEWVNDNSQSDKWGWYFTQRNNCQYALLSFDSGDDAMWFKLSFENKEHR